MKKYWRMKRRFSFCCSLVLFVMLLWIPILVHAEERRDVYEIYHTHSTNCQGVVYYTISADLSSKLSTVDTDQCDLCGGYHDYYEYTASCSCGKTWNSEGHACINSPYGTNGGSCSNYSAVDASTTHLHPVTEYICGKTEETVVETITIEKSTMLPAKQVVVTAVASGELDNVRLAWESEAENNEEQENAVLTVNENGTYGLSVIYVDAGTEYVMEMEIVVDNVDNVQPVVEEIAVSQTKFTAESVVLSVVVSDEGGLPAEYISWNGEAFGDSSQYEITENGTYEIVIRDIAGNTFIQSVTVENIDNMPPEIISLKSEPFPWYSGECTVSVSAIDTGDGNAGSGLAEMAYSWDGGISWTEHAAITLSEPGEVVVSVRDAVGNISTERLDVEKQELPVPSEPEISEEETSESKESNTEEVNKEPISESENRTEEESWEEEESEDEAEYQEVEMSVSGTEVEVEEVIPPEAELQTEEVLLSKPDIQEEKVILPEQSQQEEENVLVEREIREDDEIQSHMNLLPGTEAESNLDNVATMPIVETEEKKVNKILVIVCASGIVLGGIGFAIVGLITHILFGMCKVYEVGNQQKESYLGNTGIRPYKKGYRIIIGTDIVDQATGRNLKIKIPSWFVRFKEFKLLQIVVGEEVIDKYVEQNIDVHINM